MMLAGSLAISSKFLLQVEKKHFFNPANFGIIAALILTPDAWVSPGQWEMMVGMPCYFSALVVWS
jgi:Na+-transporting NADH:ubiquinone oxidoreductase subunit NqrB